LPEGHEHHPFDAQELGPRLHPRELVVHAVVESQEAVKRQADAEVGEQHHVQLGARWVGHLGGEGHKEDNEEVEDNEEEEEVVVVVGVVAGGDRWRNRRGSEVVVWW
jgi:hypothetical protein